MSVESIVKRKDTKPTAIGGINLIKILQLLRRFWYYFLISLLLSAIGAYYFLNHTIPSYSVSTTILIDTEGSNNTDDMLEGFAVRPGIQNLDNQLLILRSHSLISSVVEELPFEVDVFKKGFTSQLSYYPLIPLIIESDNNGYPYGVEFVFEHIYNDQFHLSVTSKNMPKMDTILSFRESVEYLGSSFSIFPNQDIKNEWETGQKIYFRFYNENELTEYYLNNLSVGLASREGSIVRLSLQGSNIIKNIVFLDKLTEVYINNNLRSKNTEANRVIEFISNQLINVSDSLVLTEDKLQEFRSRNRIMDVSAQAQQIMDQAAELDKEKARLILERNYYTYLDDYLSSKEYEQAPVVSPSSMGVDDPLLSRLMQELTTLQAEYISSGIGVRNPLQNQLESRISNTKNSIEEVLEGMMVANQMAIDDVTEKINDFNAQASRLPVKERQLLGIERKFNLNNVLYTYLMQERAKAQIQSASNTPDYILIDSPRSMGKIFPSIRNTIFIAIFLAILLPILIIILRDLIGNRITTEEDLQAITKLPVVGHIPHSRLSYNTIVLNEPNSIVAEAFRSLRTRLEFFSSVNNCQVLVVSSSQPGDGKTFLAINLASTLSLAGKKTVLVAFDLRRPTLSKSFELDNEDGITNYLIEKRDLDEIIQKTGFENLDIISSGPIPPNPGELSGSERAMKMIPILRDKYDAVVFDSAPVGIVSDIYPIASMADLFLMATRHGHTKQRVLSATLMDLEDHGIQAVSLLVNDMRSTDNTYRYSYKYKYNYK